MRIVPPPAIIENFRIRYATAIDGRHTPTGACRHVVGGQLMGPAAGLAIGQYDGVNGFYLLYCDHEWTVVTDTFHVTLEEAFDQAQYEYVGVGETWQALGEG